MARDNGSDLDTCESYPSGKDWDDVVCIDQEEPKTSEPRRVHRRWLTPRRVVASAAAIAFAAGASGNMVGQRDRLSREPLKPEAARVALTTGLSCSITGVSSSTVSDSYSGGPLDDLAIRLKVRETGAYRKAWQEYGFKGGQALMIGYISVDTALFSWSDRKYPAIIARPAYRQSMDREPESISEANVFIPQKAVGDNTVVGVAIGSNVRTTDTISQSEIACGAVDLITNRQPRIDPMVAVGGLIITSKIIMPNNAEYGISPWS